MHSQSVPALARPACRLRPAAVAAGLIGLLALWPLAPARAQERSAAPPASASSATQSEHFGKLFDAVVERTVKSFWDQDLLASSGWEQRAAERRGSVAEAPSHAEAVERINALLGELETSHTGLLTADEPEYYILLDVFSGGRRVKEFVTERFWGGGVRYGGVGVFSRRIDGRDYVDQVLEGSPADRAGLAVGDEILSVDGAPYHPIRSFRGKVGDKVRIARRRAADAPADEVSVEVVSIAPLRAFREATLASARVIERGGRRIGYVHVWASVGDKSTEALREAIGIAAHGRASGDREHAQDDSAPPPLDGLLIDMRGKIGGTGGNAASYLGVIDPRGPLLRSRNKDDKDRKRSALRGRTALLIDHHTRSTAELFVHSYRRERQGPLVGTRTAGAVSAAGAYIMPGGDLLYLAVTGLEVDGEILEGAGIAPDIEVARPIPYSQGADPVIDAAVDALVQRAQGAGGQPSAGSSGN